MAVTDTEITDVVAPLLQSKFPEDVVLNTERALQLLTAVIAGVGTEFTVTVTLAVFVHPPVLVTVTV